MDSDQYHSVLLIKDGKRFVAIAGPAGRAERECADFIARRSHYAERPGVMGVYEFPADIATAVARDVALLGIGAAYNVERLDARRGTRGIAERVEQYWRERSWESKAPAAEQQVAAYTPVRPPIGEAAYAAAR